MTADKNPSESKPHSQNPYLLALLALGVVFGDIGTSPLYALRECFSREHGIMITPENVFGVLSLIFWSLIIVVSIKYLVFVLRADNEGEGGILALLTLVLSRDPALSRRRGVLIGIGIFGSALFYGDGILTPAISVLSAVEGLKLATPVFDPYVVPITVAILVALFLFQSRGTGVVGLVFGPVMLLWFFALGLIGTLEIIKTPEVLASVNPLYAVNFFSENRFAGFVVLGSVFLVATGGEALYADIGHFGKRPIRLVWFTVALPGLLLNYFGQGALLIGEPEAVRNPFYLLAPSWGLYPLIVLATMATIIASQAVISGAFSLTHQAIQLGYLPRLEVRHTSSEEIGQVYVSWMNWALLGGTVSLVLGFRSSENLAGAYGVAIAALMVVTTVLMFVYSRTHLRWSLPTAVSVAAVFLAVDLAFFGANLLKFKQGAWLPLLVAACIYLLITTWNQGRALLRERFSREQMPIKSLLDDLASDPLPRVPGTAVFMVGSADTIPHALLHNLKHNKVIHERVVFLTVITEEVPRVSRSRRLEIKELAPDFFRIVARVGFIENPNVPAILRQAAEYGLECNMMDTTFFLGSETLVVGGSRKMSRWRKKLFVFMSRNAQKATAHFGIPSNRAIEIGAQIEI